MALTFTQAVSKLTSKFPHLNLVEFNGVRYPTVIVCPIHERVTCSTFKSMLDSKSGCPKCASYGVNSHKIPEDTIDKLSKNTVLEDTVTGETLTFPSRASAARSLGINPAAITDRIKGRVHTETLLAGRYKVHICTK
ncbi:TPA: DUF723 domain-containing protein [Neisseria meningitidis]